MERKFFKKICITLSAFVCLTLLSGCCLKHDWKEATCTEPITCSKCGKTQGEPLGHDWEEATCTEPKTCSICGETDGVALGHKAEEATCTKASVCSVCGETVEDALGHDWKEATVTAPKTCRNCGLTEGSPKEISYFDMSFKEYVASFNSEYADYGLKIITGNSGFYLQSTDYGFNTKGYSNVLLIFNDDEFDGTSSAYSTEMKERFNMLTFRYISSSDNFSTSTANLINQLGCVMAMELTGGIPSNSFCDKLEITKSDKRSTYSENGYDYEYCWSGPSKYQAAVWYEYTVSLSDNH